VTVAQEEHFVGTRARVIHQRLGRRIPVHDVRDRRVRRRSRDLGDTTATTTREAEATCKEEQCFHFPILSKNRASENPGAVQLNKAGNGIAAIEHLAGQCQTSLTATAIRFVQRSPDATAIVVSGGKKVEYCFMSDTLRDADGLDWIRKGSLLPPNSVTKQLNSDPKNVLDSERMETEGTVQDWFGGDSEAALTEETIGLGDYGKTLTVLTVDELPDAEEIEDEEDLEESWTPRFKR